jgi:hypothetical protein
VKKAQGVKLGRPRTTPVSIRQRIRQKREQGRSLPAIATALNSDRIAPRSGWHPSTVSAALKAV